jgi:hypothetical protein
MLDEQIDQRAAKSRQPQGCIGHGQTDAILSRIGDRLVVDGGIGDGDVVAAIHNARGSLQSRRSPPASVRYRRAYGTENAEGSVFGKRMKACQNMGLDPEPKPGRRLGGRSRTRTCDPLIKSQLLYQLSYAPRSGPAGGQAGHPRNAAI